MSPRSLEVVLAQLKAVRTELKRSHIRERRLRDFVQTVAMQGGPVAAETVLQGRKLLAMLYPPKKADSVAA